LTIEPIHLLAAFLIVSVVAMLMAWDASRDARRIAREQHDALMLFHEAGRSLAAHNLERARIDLAMRQADAQRATAEAMQAREEREAAAAAMSVPAARGRFGAIDLPRNGTDGP